MHLSVDDPLAIAVTQAIKTGDVQHLTRLLAENPGLSTQGIHDPKGGYKGLGVVRSLLHVATDWPGHFPNNAATVRALVAAGAEVNASFVGPHSETPLHWAASTDDVEVLEVLLELGAWIEAPGGVIGNGTPLADAVAFGQWRAAKRLVERGASTTLWQAAALGLLDRVRAAFARDPQPSADEITNAFWCACHGGEPGSAEYLLARGADLNWIGHDGLTPLDAARRSGADALVAWLRGRGALVASDLAPSSDGNRVDEASTGGKQGEEA